MEKLTNRQSQVLATITRLAKANQRWPTMRELASELNLSGPNAVMCHIRALEAKGVLLAPSGERRRAGIRVAGPCPCCGK